MSLHVAPGLLWQQVETAATGPGFSRQHPPGVAGSRANTCDPLARFSELRPIVDRPIIQFAIEEARAAGVEEFIFVTCDEKFALESHLTDAWPLNRDLVAAAIVATIMAIGRAMVAQEEPQPSYQMFVL